MDSHILGDQLNVIAKLRQLAGPMMRVVACFHPNQARFNLGEERQQLRPSLRPVEGDLVVFSDPVNLKNVLGQIKADCGNLHWVAPPMSRYEHLHYGALRRRLTQEPSTPSALKLVRWDRTVAFDHHADTHTG